MSNEKDIASFAFDISKAQSQLEDLSNIINKLSENSETKFKNMAKNIENTFSKIDFGGLDLSKLNSYLDKYENLSQKTLEKLIVDNNKAQNQITVNTNREAQKRLTQEQNINLKRTLESEKTSNKMLLQEQKAQQALNKVTQSGLTDRLKQYGEFFLSFNGFEKLKQSALDFVDTMKSVETRMTEISRIMEDGSINVQNYRDEIIQLGYDYSRTFDEVSTVTLNFARAGYDANDSIAMTEKSLLALNTAELDANQATDGLISIMAQWGLNTGTTTEKAKNLEAIIDKINKTADNFPVTSEGLLEALKRTSQGFNLAGASIDETIALIVAAETAAQRGGKEIGTAMANMIQQLKAEGKLNLAEELGLNFYEDEAKTVFKSITDIFAEMSEMMSQLKAEGKESSTEMQSLLELFTVFRRNIGAGLLSEMEGEDSTYVKALENSMNALNYSVEENSKYMNTSEAATKRFQDTLLQLQTTIWDQSGEGFFYAIINSGESLLNTLNKIIDTFGGLPTAIGAATLAYTAFNKQIQAQVNFADDKFSLGFSGDTVNKIKKAKEEVEKLKQILKEGTETNYKFSDSFKQYVDKVGVADVTTKGYIASLAKQKAATLAAEVATISLQAAMSIGLSLAITGVIALISSLINKQKDYIESNNEIIQNSKDKIQELENENKTISDVIERYKELSKSEVRTPEVNKEIISLQEQIEESLGNQASSIDLINGKYEVQISKLNQILDENRKIAIENAKTANIAAQSNYNVGTSAFVQGGFFKSDEEVAVNVILQSTDDLNEAYNRLAERQEYLNSLISQMEEKGMKSYLARDIESYNQELQITTNVMGQLKEKIDAVTDSEDTLNDLLAEDYFADNIQGNISSLQDFQKAIDEINQMPLMEGFKGDIEKQQELLRGLIEKQYPELAQKLNELNADKFEESFEKNTNGIKDNINSILDEFKYLNSEQILEMEVYGTEEQKTAYKDLKDLADEYNMSISTLLSTLEELGLIQSSVSKTTSTFKDETEQLKEALSTENKAFNALETAMNSYNQNGELTNEEVMSMLQTAPQLAKYLIKVGDSYKLNEAALQDYNKTQENTNTLVDKYVEKLQEQQFGTKDFVNTYNDFLDAINEQYDFESINNLTEQIKEVNQSFLDGETNATEYFNSLQEQIANIGQINIIDGEQTTEEIEGMQALFASFTQTTAEGIEYIQSQFESGQMNFEDYSLSMQEATDNIIDLYAKANELTFDEQTQQWLDSSGAVNEYANSLQQAKDELEGFNNVLSSIYDNSEFLKGSLTEFGTVAIDSAQVGTEAYNNYVNSFAAGLDFMVGKNDEAYNAIVSAVEGVVGYTINTSDELKYAIAGNAEALSAATNESAKQTGNSLGKLTQSAGNVIDALGKVIANFKYSITIVPSGSLKFSLENLLKGGNAFEGSGLKLNLYGEGGSSVSKLAGALQSFGSNLANLNFGSVNIGNILNAGSYTPSSYNRPYTPTNYSGGSSRGSSGGSSGSGASSTTEKNTILQDFKDAISERENEEKRWVDKQKELNQLSLNDQKYILQQEIERYKKYSDEVMKLTGVTEEEKLRVRKEYLQKAEDLELDYIGLLEDELNDAIDAIKKKYDERIDKINETADAEIEALKKVEDENDRIREKEEYLARRDEIIHGHQGIEYWEQRTGREAQLALAEARKELEDLDKEWKEKQEGWNTEDQIQAIEDRRDAEIEAVQATMDAEIAALQATYDYRVKQFAETGKIIFDEATIQSKALYNTYKTNFIDPVGSELRDALNQYASTQTTSTSSSRDYTIQWGDTLTSIASRFGTTISKIMAANPYITDKNRIYAGNTLKIPSSHTGSKILKDGLVNLQAGETVLNMKWARDLDRMLEAYSRPTSKNNTINNNASNVNVKGNMIQIDAKIEDKSDINTLTRRIERTLQKKFEIK